MPELYRTHSKPPDRGTLWENTATGRLYKVTKTKWYGAVGIVYGNAATLADASAEFNDALRAFGRKVLDARRDSHQ